MKCYTFHMRVSEKEETVSQFIMTLKLLATSGKFDVLENEGFVALDQNESMSDC